MRVSAIISETESVLGVPCKTGQDVNNSTLGLALRGGAEEFDQLEFIIDVIVSRQGEGRSSELDLHPPDHVVHSWDKPSATAPGGSDEEPQEVIAELVQFVRCQVFLTIQGGSRILEPTDFTDHDLQVGVARLN